MRGDILEQDADAIVALLPQNMKPRLPAAKAMLEATQSELAEYIGDEIRSPKIGQVYVSQKHGLPSRYILLCVRRNWKDDFDRRDSDIIGAARAAMDKAEDLGARTITFTPLGIEDKGFPPARGARFLVKGICDRLDASFKEVRIVCAQAKAYNACHRSLRALGWIG